MAYDVYVGPAKNNVHWQLAASKWYLPQIRSMEEYRKAIVVQQENNLSELQGKVLACFCGPTKRCHGNVLLYLLQPGIPEEEKAVLITGDSSPLSNSYPMKFVWEGKEFHSLAHAYYYCLAKTNCSSSALLDQIVCAPTLKSAAAAWRKCSACPSLCSQKRIEMMYKLLLLKWAQCKKFKRACREFGNRLIIQNSKDPFWGRGCSDGEGDVSCFDGMNISGWLLVALYERKKIFLSDQNLLFDRLKLRLLRCTKGKANEKLLRGALLVSTQICT